MLHSDKAKVSVTILEYFKILSQNYNHLLKNNNAENSVVAGLDNSVEINPSQSSKKSCLSTIA